MLAHFTFYIQIYLFCYLIMSTPKLLKFPVIVKKPGIENLITRKTHIRLTLSYLKRCNLSINPNTGSQLADL